MSEQVATVVARALVVVAAAVVLVRFALLAPGRRERSGSLLQLASLVEVASVWILFWHPLAIVTPGWYDPVVRPLGAGVAFVASALVGWAYVRLGRFWDAAISVREDHRVVRDGPFAIVRHPVYLGLIFFLLGGTLLEADPLVGAASFVTAVVVAFRAREEERFLEERLGDEYRAYARRVPMLLPWPRR